MKVLHKEQGLLSLEACISVTIFIFLMLFMYSYFVVFEARNAIGHAILSTANSLSLDAYANSTLNGSSSIAAIPMFNSIFDGLYGAPDNGSHGFVDESLWYDGSTEDDGNGGDSLSSGFEGAIKTRFFAYFGGGDDDRVDKLLKSYHVKNGRAGLDFSNSRIIENDLYLSVRYTLEYEFQVFDIESVQFEQKACSRLWKND